MSTTRLRGQAVGLSNCESNKGCTEGLPYSIETPDPQDVARDLSYKVIVREQGPVLQRGMTGSSWLVRGPYGRVAMLYNLDNGRTGVTLMTHADADDRSYMGSGSWPVENGGRGATTALAAHCRSLDRQIADWLNGHVSEAPVLCFDWVREWRNLAHA